MGIRLKFLAYFCLISEVFTGELVKPPDGNGLFITGRGCGGSTKIRYLTYIPEDLEKHECTFINLKYSEPPNKASKCVLCKENSKCSNTNGDYTCQCSIGYFHI